MKTNLSLLSLVVILLVTCNPASKNVSEDSSREPMKKAGNDNWKEYKNLEYNFSVKLPPEWESREFSTGEKYPTFNFYKAVKRDVFDFPIAVHADAGASFVAVYPKGYGVELPMGKSRKMNENSDFLNAAVNNNESTVFLLENDQEWGYFIVPSSPPANWSEHGFIFTQIATDNFEAQCFDKQSGEELEMSECDPMMGDIVKRTGQVNRKEKETVQRILQRFSFKNLTGRDTRNEVSEGMQVDQPASGAKISSPLKIRGKARGNWYFEAEFTVSLMQNGEKLAEAIVKAEGEWMTNDFVPFVATMDLPEEVENGKAFLRFKNNNASGRSELDKTFSVPVHIAGQ